MKNLTNQKGITLVALVVTIIVLLILAGVSLSLVAGSDGILGRATNAVDKHQIATIKEKIELKVAEQVENFYEAKYVDRNVDNATTTLQYISETNVEFTEAESSSDPETKTTKGDRTYFSEAGAEYQITFTPSTGKFYVQYKKGKTALSGKKPTTDTDKTVTGTFLKGSSGDVKFNYVKELAGSVSENGSLTWD